MCPVGRWRAALVLVVLAALIAGCRRSTERRVVEEALAVQRSVPVPMVPATRLPPPPLRLRILVHTGGIDVDAVDLFASWPEKRRQRLLRELPEGEARTLPFVHRNLVRIAGGGIAPPDGPGTGLLEIRALSEVLAYARDLTRRYARIAEEDRSKEPEAEPAPEGGPGPRFEVNVYAAADTPYQVLVSVLYTIYQSEYEPTLVARGPGGDVALPLAVPRSGGHAVPEPRIAFRTDGLSVSLEHPFRVRLADPPFPGHGAAVPTRLGRPIVSDHTCPSVPLHEGAPDLARLRALLTRIRERIPHLDGAVVVPATDTPWAAVAGVAAVAVDAGLTQYMVAVPQPNDPPPRCEAPVRVDDLEPGDAPTRPSRF